MSVTRSELNRYIDTKNFTVYSVFKNRLDKFWENQPVKFDWKACLTGTGDRSEFKVENDEKHFSELEIEDVDIEAVLQRLRPDVQQ